MTYMDRVSVAYRIRQYRFYPFATVLSSDPFDGRICYFGDQHQGSTICGGFHDERESRQGFAIKGFDQQHEQIFQHITYRSFYSGQRQARTLPL